MIIITLKIRTVNIIHSNEKKQLKNSEVTQILNWRFGGMKTDP